MSLGLCDMSTSPEVIHPQNVAEFAQCWKITPLARKDSGKGSACTRLASGDASSSGDDTKVRKPYTITKQRERWTDSEHQKFLEALKLYGRAWRRIEEYIGTKTAVQIRSHAQKFFSKLEREASTGSSAGKIQEIEIPPPRPKRKPSRPYPKKAGRGPLTPEDDSKEAISGQQTPVRHEGIQSGSCNPYFVKGLRSGLTPLCRGPVVPGHFFGSEGSMKLFGKMVVVPEDHTPVAQNDSSSRKILNGESTSIGTQTIKPDFERTTGFSPFVNLRHNVEGFSEEPLHRDNNGETLANDCGGNLAVINKPEAAHSNALHEGEEHQHGDKVGIKAIAHTCGLPEHGVSNSDMQFPHRSQHSNPMHQWMDGFACYCNGLSVPPVEGHGLREALPTNPLTYWQFLQALAANYATFTAAMAAAAVTGWTGPIAGCEESAQTTGNDAFHCAASSWWPFRGFMPFMGSVNQELQFDAAGDTHSSDNGNEGAALQHISSQGQYPVKSEIVDETEMSKPCSKFDLENGEKRQSAKNGSILGTSCITEAPFCESILQDSAGQHETDVAVMRAKYCTQQSDTERRGFFEYPQSLYSSSEEFEGQVKKQEEGSSSGSNTPPSRCRSAGECKAQTSMESKKRDCHRFFEDNTDSCSDVFMKPHHQLCGVNTMESPSIWAEHAEKGRKHQQKDFRHGHGDGDDSKRLKSCAHELEVRKEVSQEGRKAFEALFNSKLLPQTFPAADKVEGMHCTPKQETVSRSPFSKAEFNSINVPNTQVPMQRASTSPDESPDGQESGTVHIIENLSNTVGAYMEFTVSPGSGFVPYRRPLCTKPKVSSAL